MTKSQATMKIGLLGIGKFGATQLELLLRDKRVELVGYYDTNAEHSLPNSQAKKFETLESLINLCDVISIATDTASHYNTLNQVLKTAKSILIARPMVNNIHQAKEINALAQEAKTHCHIIYLDRMHPCFEFAQNNIPNPKLIRSQKEISYTSTQDEHLIYEGMVDQIDIILKLITSPIKSITARGFSNNNSKIPDIVNAHIDFFNGEFATIMTSRLSHTLQNSLALYDTNKSIQLDFTKHTCQMNAFGENNPQITNTNYQEELNKNANYCLEKCLDTYIESYLAGTNYSSSSPSVLANEYDALKSLEVTDIIANQVEKYMNYIN